MTSAYEAAKAGGKHAGFLRSLSAMGPRQRSSAVQSFTDQITLHRDKLAFPERYVQNWGALREGHRQSLLREWRKEVLDHEEQIGIIKGYEDANP